MSDATFALRDAFDAKCVRFIAAQIGAIYKPFDSDAFISQTLHAYEPLGFSQRLERIISMLEKHLPTAFDQSAPILIAALGDAIDEPELTGFEGFYVMPLSLYIARHGQSHFELSMHALYEMTKRFTSEFAIRYFLLSHPQQSLAFLASIASDENPHVRRLVSEGSRTRLPMAMRLQPFIQEPSAVLQLLELLKHEPTRLVQRSIANSLNDLSKDHPTLVTTLLKRWQQEGVMGINWMLPHALRTLIKQGDANALALLGYSQTFDIDIDVELANTQLTVGEHLEFTINLTSNMTHNIPVLIDFIIGFKKANGTLSPKVFKLSKKELAPAQPLRLTKRHLLRQATTRKLYGGEHTLQLQINGKPCGVCLPFTLSL